jgi:hypothetical protein
VIENGGSLAEVEARAAELWREIEARAAAGVGDGAG